MSKLTLMVGAPGSGKTTYAHQLPPCRYVNQDSQGRQHLDYLNSFIANNENIVVDRMGFNLSQRDRYLRPAKEKGYETEIVVLHESYKTCFERVMARKDHPTIKNEESARSALNTFFTKYERVQDSEADKVTRIWPSGEKPKAVYSDLDGTLALVEHRRHFVQKEGKKDWNGFFKEMVNDPVNQPVMDTLKKFSNTHRIIYCSGRPDNWRKETERWLMDKDAPNCFCLENYLFMRSRNDSRQDNIVKEILLDFEILTRYSIDFCLDDRDQVVKMLRSRGLIVFQVADGDF